MRLSCQLYLRNVVKHRDSPYSSITMAQFVDQILLQLCEQEEADRLHAVEAMLQLGQRSDKARGIRVTKDYSPELGETENSRLSLLA